MKKIFWLVLLAMTWISAEVVALSDSNYEQKIKGHSKAVIMFSAPWCGACKSMKPTYEKFALEDAKKTFLGRLNTDNNQKITALYKVESLPTLVFLENGKEIKRTVGGLDMEELNLFVHTEKALTTYSKKCDDGDSNICLDIGELYEEGELFKRDYAKALDFYKKSCTLKNAEGCMYLAYMYDEALGLKQDYKMAIKYYTQGCDGQNMISCRFLGYLYDEGLGTDKDYKKAHDLYIKACDSEDKYACNNLGYMYTEGNGVTKNPDKALDFYGLSCKFGHDDACEKIKDLID